MPLSRNSSNVSMTGLQFCQLRRGSLPAERGFALEGRPASVGSREAIVRQGKAVGATQRRVDGEGERAAGHHTDTGLFDRMGLVGEVATKECMANSMRPSTRPSGFTPVMTILAQPMPSTVPSHWPTKPAGCCAKLVPNASRERLASTIRRRLLPPHVAIPRQSGISATRRPSAAVAPATLAHVALSVSRRAKFRCSVCSLCLAFCNKA